MTKSTSTPFDGHRIRNDADLRAANAALAGLLNAAPGSPAEACLDELTELIEAYEARHHPMPAPDPVDAILFRVEQAGLTRKALEGIIGSRARVSEVLNRKREISKEMIVRLHLELGISLESLLGIGEDRRAARRK